MRVGHGPSAALWESDGNCVGGVGRIECDRRRIGVAHRQRNAACRRKVEVVRIFDFWLEELRARLRFQSPDCAFCARASVVVEPLLADQSAWFQPFRLKCLLRIKFTKACGIA